MLMKADSCTKPGYTRRPAPRKVQGTVWTRFSSNQLSGLLVASSLTAVGLTRQSMGPAISVRLRGWAGWPSCAMSAVADSAATQGWQMAMRCAPGPMRVRNWMRCSV